MKVLKMQGWAVKNYINSTFGVRTYCNKIQIFKQRNQEPQTQTWQTVELFKEQTLHAYWGSKHNKKNWYTIMKDDIYSTINTKV